MPLRIKKLFINLICSRTVYFEATPTHMIVTWVTMGPVNESVVEYGLEGLNQKQNGSWELFVDGGDEKRQMIIHRVILNNLTPGKTYRKDL